MFKKLLKNIVNNKMEIKVIVMRFSNYLMKSINFINRNNEMIGFDDIKLKFDEYLDINISD